MNNNVVKVETTYRLYLFLMYNVCYLTYLYLCPLRVKNTHTLRESLLAT